MQYSLLMMGQQKSVTSGRLRQTLLGLEDIIGMSVTETIIENLNMKGVSYALNCDNIVYHKSEITGAFEEMLGPEIAALLTGHLARQCEELC
ncbi:hypothetical protein [Nitrososphaera sp.]|uniref:hypothetical protein n=2 Tax=Nitrososphaera sp. TaxID=1971748 RepID=UPI0018367ED7|nr:hypothetical protein [Nitrososphaera sp.]NWG37703.1 hypothetical protein [Nitrososphaera sp.]